VFDQQAHGGGMTDGGVQTRRAVRKTRPREARILRQEIADGGEIAGRARAHEVGHIGRTAPVHLTLQIAPAGKAVLASDRQLRVGQLRGAVSAAQDRETIFREFFQEFVRRTFGELQRHHTPFLPQAPGVRGSRAGSQGL
jgi:hypothetical protein